jgi:hypothetical protein
LVALAVLVAAVAGSLVAVSINVATSGNLNVLGPIKEHPWWRSVIGTVAVAASGLGAW